METEVLVTNQLHYKELNNKQIELNQGEIEREKDIIVECERDIAERTKNIAELTASNLAIDETIRILKAT